MGRPDGSPSPRMNNNYNPIFHAPEEKQVQAEQKHPNNGGRVDQPSGVPMGRPGQPTNINTGGMGSQPYGVQMVRPPPVINQPSNWTSGLFDCMNDGENG